LSIISFNTKPFSLLLKSPIITSKSIITERKGFNLYVSKNGHTAYGECSPLPEFGSETLEDAVKNLNNLSIDDSILESHNFIQDLESCLVPFTGSPSLCHAVEQALVNLYAAIHNITYSKIFQVKAKNYIYVNGFIGIADIKETLNKVQGLVNCGVTTIKLKFGRPDFNEELQILEEISGLYGSKVKLRLDINGAWELGTAIKRINQFSGFNIEYIEQPVLSATELEETAANCSIPIAADESIRSVNEAFNIIKGNFIKVLVLKPMMLGGIINTLRIIEKASTRNIKTIISSSFERSHAYAYAVHCASFIKEDWAHGLGTADIFIDEYNEKKFEMKSGKIYTDAL